MPALVAAARPVAQQWRSSQSCIPPLNNKARFLQADFGKFTRQFYGFMDHPFWQPGGEQHWMGQCFVLHAQGKSNSAPGKIVYILSHQPGHGFLDLESAAITH